MDKHIRAVLTHGGVESSASTEEDLLSVLESWLGLPETNSWEDQMMEDIAPFGAPFYQALERLLVHVWQPDESTTMMPSNMLMEVDCDPKDNSLYKAMAVVRVTRLLRFWLDLNCMGSSVMQDTNEEEKGLSNLVLQHCSCEESTGKAQRYPLVQALYNHVERLPQLQSQINNYTESLMRGERKYSGKALANPQSRSSQRQEALQVAAKLNSEWNDHVEALEYIIGEWYSVGNVDVRRQCRSHLGSAWSHFVSGSGAGVGGIKMENTSSSGIRMTLRVLHRILQGTGGTLQKSHEYLLTHHLIPLHQPNSMVLWRDQTSLLELYHEPLVQCVAILLQKKPEWIPKAITALLEPEIWPVGGNTPKLVLLLHEIDTYIGLLPDSMNSSTMPQESFAKLLHTLGSCMASDHSRLAERALSMIKNKKLQSLIQVHFEFSLSLLLPFLVRSEPSWNPTVRKMTYTVLKTFQDFDDDRFLRIGAKCFPTDGASSHSSIAPVVSRAKTSGSVILQSQDGATEKPKDFSLKSAMGGWKPPMSTGSRLPSGRNSAMPPPSSRAPRAGAGPPLTVTGVAPWSMKSTALPNKSAKNPPLGITGVAPWAVQKKVPMSGKPQAGEVLSGVTEDDRLEEEIEPVQESRVLAYMKLIKPPEEEEGASVWARAQMAETPTLLPNLKFHDLVFGHDLGEGAFGLVRYARFIDRTRTRSQWPEYAVKIISTGKIKEMGYEASVQREVAVLRILSHPGIARLVSSLRFQEGVYLVLEYASGGDLHSVLRKNGSLDHASTRFVMGEIVAALASIHELGLVYGDLKPENIVITEQGHAKLSDFGACRAITPEAKRMIGDVAKNILNELRDGDWKPQSKRKEKEFDMDEDVEDIKDNNSESRYLTDDDLRIEGTTAYLPPEVVMGGFPTPAADSWALGCVLYQCLSGRPPIIEGDETLIKNRIVSFDVGKQESSHESLLFSETHAAEIESDARHLIIGLFNKNAAERPNMAQIAQHEFFRNEGTDVYTLYRHPAPPLDVGDVSPVEDAKWAGRQFSSIWAPQPQAYDVSLSTVDSGTQNDTALSSRPILEGVEATAFFSTSTSASRYATDKVPRPALKRPIEE
jgi:serine/threonine protein kinase